MQAFIYGFPYVYNAKLRHDWVTQARDPAVIPYAAVNHFWHAARVMDATYRDGGCPNNDTLYSVAWLDLGEEPVILSHPDMGEPVLHLRADGVHLRQLRLCRAAHHRQQGRAFRHLRAGLARGAAARGPGGRPAPTPWVLLLGRTLVDGDADLATVHALQAAYRLTPLSLWGKPGADGARAPRRLHPGRGGTGSAGAVEDAERDAGRKPAAAASRAGARPVRPHRHRAGPGCGRPARGGQTGPGPGRHGGDGAAHSAVPERGVGHAGQRLALPAGRRRAVR